MITWEHLRFLALMIPTWLLLGAIAVTVAEPSRDGTPNRETAAQANPVSCRDPQVVSAQRGKGELVSSAARERMPPSETPRE